MRDRCKPEQVGTKEHSKMLKRIRVLEDGRIPAEEARNWKIEGQNSWVTWEGCGRLWSGLMAQKGLRNVAREKMLQDRGVLPKEEGDIVREHQAMHEFPQNFRSSWLREDV